MSHVEDTFSDLPTRQSVEAEQADLENLCRDRPLATSEIFEPNAYYGLDHVLKRWAGVPPDEALKIAFPHGVAFKMLFFDRRERVPVLAYHWAPHGDALRRRGRTGHLWPFASPFLYADRMLGRPPAARRGTIAFVSRLGKDDPAVVEARAAELAELPSALGPVTVCLRWQDVLAGRHEVFRGRGMSVVSAGHANDPAFLFRFRHLCAAHQHVVTNGMGSHVFFAVAAGCRYVDAIPGSPGPDSRRPSFATFEDEQLWDGAVGVVGRMARASAEEQRALADELLGAEHLETPAQMVARFGEAARLDASAFVRPGLGVTVPEAGRRVALRAVDRYRSWRR